MGDVSTAWRMHMGVVLLAVTFGPGLYGLALFLQVMPGQSSTNIDLEVIVNRVFLLFNTSN